MQKHVTLDFHLGHYCQQPQTKHLHLESQPLEHFQSTHQMQQSPEAPDMHVMLSV